MNVDPTPAEVRRPMPGDGLVPDADVVMDRAFTVAATPEQVWPWIAQLGKQRAGWYLPRRIERFLPPSRRAIRHLDPQWTLAEGDVIPDYGGKHETFTAVTVEPPYTLVHRSTRGRTDVSWAIELAAVGPAATRVRLRLRLSPVKHRTIAKHLGGWFDEVTIAGMAAGLAERVGPLRP